MTHKNAQIDAPLRGQRRLRRVCSFPSLKQHFHRGMAFVDNRYRTEIDLEHLGKPRHPARAGDFHTKHKAQSTRHCFKRICKTLEACRVCFHPSDVDRGLAFGLALKSPLYMSLYTRVTRVEDPQSCCQTPEGHVECGDAHVVGERL